MIYSTKHYPRTVNEPMQLINPECWAVYIYAENFSDDSTIIDMRTWAESHAYGRFITFLHKSQNNYTVEFDREPEYMEFALQFL